MRIVAWRSAFAGDILFPTASLEGIKRRYPRSRLTFGAWSRYQNLIDTNPHIDELVHEVTDREKRKANKVWEVSHERYSLEPGEMYYWGEIHARQAAELGLLDLGEMASFKPQVYLAGGDLQPKPSGVKVAAIGSWSTNGLDARLWGVEREPVSERVMRMLADSRAGQRAMGILGPPRGRLLLNDRWSELMAALAAMGFQTVQLGGRRDPPIPGVGHDLRGALTWRQSIGLLTQADLCITIDSFLLHAALARKYTLDGEVVSEGTPTVALLGPIDGRGLFPADAERVVEVSSRQTEDCPCYNSTRFGAGPCGHGNTCMTSLTVEMVVEGVEKCLN